MTDELLARFYEPICTEIDRTCRRWHLTGADAEDLSQELWLVVLRDDARILRRFEGRSTISTYLHTVMNRSACDWLRKSSQRKRTEVVRGDTYSHSQDLETHPSHISVGGQVGAATNRSQLRQLERAVACLATVDQVALDLRYEKGWRIRVIAEFLEMSPKAVSHRIYRSLTRVREMLAGVDGAQLRKMRSWLVPGSTLPWSW